MTEGESELVGAVGATPQAQPNRPGRDARAMTGARLTDLVDRIDADPRGWDGAAGRECVELLRRECRRQASRWTGVAGSLEDEGLSVAWMELDAWRRHRTDHDPVAIVRRTIQRAYVAEAGARQSGMGDAVGNRKKIGRIVEAARSTGTGRVMIADVDLTRLTRPEASENGEPPRWALVLARMLQNAGWAWPAPAGQCVLAAAMHVDQGRRGAVDAQWSACGVPAQAWAGLALLVGGSGPGCAIEHEWPGARAIFTAGGARALLESAEIHRLVGAVVQARAVRSGRKQLRQARTNEGAAA